MEGGKETNFQELAHRTVENRKVGQTQKLATQPQATHVRNPCFLRTSCFLVTVFKWLGEGTLIQWGLSAQLKGNWFKCHSQIQVCSNTHWCLTISLAIQNQLAQLGNQCLLWNPSVLHLLGGYTWNPLVLCISEIIGVICLSASLFPFLKPAQFS